MGSVFKRVAKVIKKVRKPISKITKGIAKGIAKVAKSVMRGVSKLQNKLGPIGMIAMSMAMPGIMQGLGGAFTKMSTTYAGSPFGNFLQAAGKIGSNIKTGWTGFKSGIADKMGTITNSIKETFSGMGNGNNIFTKISDGAKKLYSKAKELTPKFKQGKTGTVQVGDMGYGFGETTSMTSEQALKAIDLGQINASQLSKQTLGDAAGFITKAGNQSDGLITDIINSTYESKIKMLDANGTRHFNSLLQTAKDSKTYTNHGEIFNYMTSGTKGTTPQYMDFTDDIIGYTTDLSKTGDYRLVGPVDGNNYVFNGNKTFSDSLEPTKFTNTIKNNSKKIITAAADTLLKKTEMPVIPEFELITSAAATGNDGTIKPLISSASIKGSEGTDFFRKQFGEPAWANLKGTVNNMGFKGDIA
jgi:hypothetical protein|tara:strand:- start:116 stop:1360 length:1245 start_codon:yes stop_codon:yes gene_type:complete